jgi:hypothetical protein
MPGNIEFVLNKAPQRAAKRISTDNDKSVLSHQLLHSKHLILIQSFSRGGLFYTINPNVQMYAGYS